MKLALNFLLVFEAVHVCGQSGLAEKGLLARGAEQTGGSGWAWNGVGAAIRAVRGVI